MGNNGLDESSSRGAVLGLVDGISDAGAALFVDGELVAAVNEERLSRVKLQGGFPARSVDEVLRIGGVEPRAVELVTVGGMATPSAVTRVFRGLQRRLGPCAGIAFDRPRSPLLKLADLVRYRLKITTNRPDSPLGRIETNAARALLRRALGDGLAGAPVAFAEHHEAHAATAFFGSGFDSALVLTADSLGDGCSLTVSRGEGRRLARLFAASPFVSFGTFFALVTRWLGFRPSRHEGKVAALAASGDAEAVPVPFPLRYEGGRLTYEGEWGLRAFCWLDRLSGCSREDVAAWLQRGLTVGVTAIARDWLRRTGLRRLAVAGGVFANVALNLSLLELPEVERLYVYPHMGDGGLAVGSALAVLRPEGFRMPRLYLGPEYEADSLAAALAGVPHFRPERPAEEVARLLAEGRVVARFTGRMEYGPRALGHRSVLAPADPGITAELNRRLNRSEFMPFAPAVLSDGAHQRLADLGRAPDCARHMTAAFRAKPALLREAPGAVHVDGTARAQVVRRSDEPELHAILAAYARRTGRRAVINTSFNRHEEPIVCRPEEAVRTFGDGGIDALLLGPFLAVRPEAVRAPKPRTSGARIGA